MNKIRVISEHPEDFNDEKFFRLAGCSSSGHLKSVFWCESLLPDSREWDPAIATVGVHVLVANNVLEPGIDVIALGSRVWRRLTHHREYVGNFQPRIAHPNGLPHTFGNYRLYLSPNPASSTPWWRQEGNLISAATFWHNAARGIMPDSSQKSSRDVLTAS